MDTRAGNRDDREADGAPPGHRGHRSAVLAGLMTRLWTLAVAGVAAAGVVVAALGVATPASGQEPLTLDAALSTASDGAYAVRIAEGEAKAQSAGPLRALQGILPTVRFESGLMRTTDPVAAFGIKLRQRSITQADFAPAVLTDPAVAENWTGAVVAEVPLLNPDAWLGFSAAGRGAKASRAAATWTEYETRADVVRAYYGAILATEKVATLEAAFEAARAHVRQAQAMVDEGLVTRSDALLAEVKAGEVEADLASARGEARTAVRQLATLLGTPDTLPVLPESLPDADPVRNLVTGRTQLHGSAPAGSLGDRPDVRAAELGLSAAQRNVLRARSKWLPRINAFGRYDWHSASSPYDGDESWTVGIMAQWTPLAGAGHVAESREAAGQRVAAEARAEAARANARLEAESSADELSTALERLAIAERAVAQAEEAHRIVTRRYEGGLATVVELLDASATETRTRLQRAGAIYAVITAGAGRALALGMDPGLFATLDDYTNQNQSE